MCCSKPSLRPLKKKKRYVSSPRRDDSDEILTTHERWQYARYRSSRVSILCIGSLQNAPLNPTWHARDEARKSHACAYPKIRTKKAILDRGGQRLYVT